MKRARRSKSFKMRCTEHELAALCRAAAAEGTTPTALARRAITGVLGQGSVSDELPRDAKGPPVTRHFRLSARDDAALQEGAGRYGVSISAFVRRAIRSAVNQQPLLSPAELATVNGAIEQFRRAAQNLNTLLRQVYLHQSEVMEKGPSADEFRFMADDLQAAAAALRQKLKGMPWGQV